MAPGAIASRNGNHSSMWSAAVFAVYDFSTPNKPSDIPPTDECAGKRKERLMDVCSSLMPDAQSAKAM